MLSRLLKYTILAKNNNNNNNLWDDLGNRIFDSKFRILHFFTPNCCRIGHILTWFFARNQNFTMLVAATAVE